MPQNQEINSANLIGTPIATPFLIGHTEAEHEFLDCFKSGHFHHSWIITGMPGIGKATLAYRIVRYIFSLNNQDLISNLSLDTKLDVNKIAEDNIDFNYDSDEEDSDNFSFSSDDLIIPQSQEKEKSTPTDSALQSLDNSPLKLSPKHPIFERLLAGGLTDLFVVEREYSDAAKTKLKTEISIEQIRKLKEFFSKTSSEGGYKIAIVDSVDNLNTNSSNALLKILEEAPNKSLLLLICNNYEGLIDTIKSRCRVLKLHPLSDENMEILLSEYIREISPENIKQLIHLAHGSIGAALDFYNNNGIEISEKLYSSLPEILSRKNRKILDITTLVGYSEIKFKIFSQALMVLIENIIRINTGLTASYSSEIEERATKFCAQYFVNTEKLFKLREKFLSYFELTPVLNLDYTAVIISLFERLKNAYR